MLEVVFKEETLNDCTNPLTIANALIVNAEKNHDDREDAIAFIGEIATHLQEYRHTQLGMLNRKKMKAEEAIYWNNRR